MKTYKYVAPTMRDALARIKEELGEDALIIRSEKVKTGGSINAIRQELIEVTAAPSSEVKAETQLGPEFAETLEKSISRQSTPERHGDADMQISHVSDEIRQLREDLTDISKFLKNNQLEKLPKELAKAYTRIGKSGLNSQWAADLAHDALLRLEPEDLTSAQAVENFLTAKISNAVRAVPKLVSRLPRAYKIMLVGSPGAGKTTLIQKLASDPAAYGKRKVGLISLDTHRMAAVEQMRAFARIAGMTLEVCFQPAQAAAAVSKVIQNEIILIDTPGCTALDGEKIQLLHRFVAEFDPDEVHLVLNSTVRDDELMYAARKFRDVGMSHISFTRLDESLRHGFLINVAKVAERPVAWLSRGQGFVGCVERFTPDHLRQWIALAEPMPEFAAMKAEFSDQTVGR